ncbi:type II toxin-antitoxin system Phd/YefM family antitoxin [Jiella pacifica]|uniref:Antitoxin n=1 Tax=Jiella pacifica TaxID=2696469 RepID=A0A6N9T8R1_9HYPH|nr:type II toxin-antitoxin system prevent-host-death family antitoxin [Jiella pacifica]NDW07824.1 type II toxin-antitoxin system prevent-host-death family antitoxin [Jiella pacifica]|tara:strand:+ start:85 stop:336 length:252 start_codon:yes stop_codon:yes gene_type:complete
MREIGAFEAKNTLGTLLDLVEHGEEVVITRRGKRVARLVPEARTKDRDGMRAAAERIRARAEAESGPSISVDEWKSYRDEGRA